MKLSLYTKQAIVSSIMNDTPVMSEARLRADVQKALVAAMSLGARKLFKTTPKALAVGTQYFESQRCTLPFVTGDADFRDVLKPFMAAEEKRKSVKHNLASAIGSCSTLKQAQAMFPEFVRYMPTEEQPTKNLPALASVVADLVVMGWPQGRSK